MEPVLKARARDRNSARAIADPEIKIVGSKAREAGEPAGVRAAEKAKVQAAVRGKDEIQDRAAGVRPELEHEKILSRCSKGRLH